VIGRLAHDRWAVAFGAARRAIGRLQVLTLYYSMWHYICTLTTGTLAFCLVAVVSKHEKKPRVACLRPDYL